MKLMATNASRKRQEFPEINVRGHLRRRCVQMTQEKEKCHAALHAELLFHRVKQ
jgi:hypothetical protein